MKKINSTSELRDTIAMLEHRQVNQKMELKSAYSHVVDNLQPGNIVKHVFQSSFGGENKSNLLKTLLGLGSGILTRRIIGGGASSGIIRKIFGSALQFGVAGVIAKNAETIKEKGTSLIGKLVDLIKKNRKPSGIKSS